MSALDRFAAGTVIPAHPLALTEELRLDEQRQRALARYYLDAGAGGLAVGVHTTQFALHTTHRDLLRPVLELASQEATRRADTVLVAGSCGPTKQAVAEAELAAELGYHAVLLAPLGTENLDENGLLERAQAVGEVLPVIGFYLQSAVGGRLLERGFWTRLADQPNVIGVKVAPFDRYRTLDVMTGVAASGRAAQVALYTGNDDHIVQDLLARYPVPGGELRFVGGLLGQWSVWTSKAVEILRMAQQANGGDGSARAQLGEIDLPLTDANGAIFDVRGGFVGCVPGLHEILRRQGLLDGVWCLDPHEVLSPGQMGEIDRVLTAYPQLRDDEFVAEHRDEWMS